jgi:hypothetical protein
MAVSHLIDFVTYPVLLLAVPAAVFMRKIAGSDTVDLSRILAECGEMEPQKRTAVSILVALWAFSLYLCLNSDLIFQVFFSRSMCYELCSVAPESRRQAGSAHKIFVDPTRRLTPFVDRPYH